MNFTVALLTTALALSMASSVAAESDGGNVFSGVHHAKVVSCSG